MATGPPMLTLTQLPLITLPPIQMRGGGGAGGAGGGGGCGGGGGPRDSVAAILLFAFALREDLFFIHTPQY